MAIPETCRCMNFYGGRSVNLDKKLLMPSPADGYLSLPQWIVCTEATHQLRTLGNGGQQLFHVKQLKLLVGSLC